MHDRGQQRRKQRSRYLVSQVGKEASATDAAHAATEPPRSAFAAFSLSRHDRLPYGRHARQIDGDRWRSRRAMPPPGRLCENLLYGFKAAPRGRSRRRIGTAHPGSRFAPAWLASDARSAGAKGKGGAR